MNIARTTRLQRQISALRPQFSIHSDALRSLGRQPTRSLYVSSICKAKAEPVTIHVRSTNTSKKGQNQARNTYAGQEKVKGGKKDSLWKSWQNLTLGTKMGVAFAIGLVGVIGLITSDYLEQRMAQPETTDTKAPKKTRLLGISVVDRKDASK